MVRRRTRDNDNNNHIDALDNSSIPVKGTIVGDSITAAFANLVQLETVFSFDHVMVISTLDQNSTLEINGVEIPIIGVTAGNVYSLIFDNMWHDGNIRIKHNGVAPSSSTNIYTFSW